MNTLTKQQIRQLKIKAHALKPVVIIGAQALTSAVHREIELALSHHELIKIRVNARDKDHRKQLIEEICQVHQAILILSVGHTAAFYREKSD